MLQASTPTCARCGAPLPGGVDVLETRCEYCGAHTRFAPGEGPPSALPSASATRDAKRLLLISGIAVMGVMVAISLVGALASRPPSTETRGVDLPAIRDQVTLAPSKIESPPPAVMPSALLSGLLLFDVDHDGFDDILGVFEGAQQPPSRWIGALSGADGHVLWTLRDEGLGAWPDPEPGFRALVGDTFFFVDPAGSIHAVDAYRGTPRWSQRIAGAARDLCSDGFVVEILAGGSAYDFALATGEPVPADPARPCDPAYTSRSEGPNFRVVDGDRAGALIGSVHAGMLARRAIVPFVGTARVVLGDERSSGAPVLAVVASARLLWRKNVATAASREASLFDPARAAVRYDRVVVPYFMTNPASLDVASFELASGKRLWDVALARVLGERSGEVAIGQDRRVFVRTDAGRLWVLELGDGAGRLVIGGP